MNIKDTWSVTSYYFTGPRRVTVLLKDGQVLKIKGVTALHQSKARTGKVTICTGPTRSHVVKINAFKIESFVHN